MSSEPPAGKTILVVEDDALIRSAMKMVLEWEGYRVACAANGREALDYLHRGPKPTLILLDVAMPVLDGRGFREEQKRDPALAPIPVVVVSGGDPTVLDAAGHVHKPFQPEQLLETVRRQG